MRDFPEGELRDKRKRIRHWENRRNIKVVTAVRAPIRKTKTIRNLGKVHLVKRATRRGRGRSKDEHVSRKLTQEERNVDGGG